MTRYIDVDSRITEIRKNYCAGCENYGGVRCRSCWVDDAIGLFEDAPTVDAVPVVHGRWIIRGGKRYCSACQKRACVTRDTDDFWYTVGTDYCPNCGARMDGGNNEETKN